MTRMTSLLLAGAVILAGPAAVAAVATLPAPAGPTLGLDLDPDDGPDRLLLASGGEDDDDGWRSGGRGDDDEDEDDDDDDDDCGDDEDGGACAMGVGPAKAGTVAPPANGLFGSGAAPQVQVR